MVFQRTISREVEVTGIGLHTGKKIRLKLRPAPADFGIQFNRVDIPGAPNIEALSKNVGATENNTSLGEGKNIVNTVEHLISVLYGMGINNILCEIDGPEVPIMDGSAASLIFLLKEAGIATLHKPKNFLVVLEKVRVEHEDKWAEITPASRLTIDSTIVFAHPKINTQRKTFDFTCESYLKHIGRARTFGFLKQVDYLKRRGLIKGASLDNAIVFDDYNVVNPEGLRFEDECIRHKILDTIGDVALLGHELVGKITTYKSGHHLHNLLCHKLLATPSAYEIIPASSLKEDTKSIFDLSQIVTVAQ